MGDEVGFWRHWRRGGVALRRVGSAVFFAALGSLLAVAAVVWAIGMAAQYLFSWKIVLDEPVTIAAAVAAVAGTLLLAPMTLSADNDERALFPALRLKPPSAPPRPVAMEIAEGLCFLDGALCEQARPEMSGQWTLIGVYGHAIMVDKFPARIDVSGIVTIELTKAFTGIAHIRFRLDEREVARGETNVDGTLGRRTIILRPRAVDVAQAAALCIDMSADAVNWTEVMCKAVTDERYDAFGEPIGEDDG